MSYDEITNTEFDTELTRLFAEKNEVLPDHEFTPRLLLKLDHEYRVQQIRRWFAVVIVLMLAAIAAPWVVRLTGELLSLASDVGALPGLHKIAAFGMLLLSGVMIFRARRQIKSFI